ncbi:hypothetical protein [Arthrobacter sp. D3-16]
MRDLQSAARILLQRKTVALIDIWILYWNNGGRYHPFEFDAIIHGLLPATWFDMEALGYALDELMLEPTG